MCSNVVCIFSLSNDFCIYSNPLLITHFSLLSDFWTNQIMMIMIINAAIVITTIIVVVAVSIIIKLVVPQ